MSERDSIEALLRATGRRPVVRDEVIERVRDVVRAEWLQAIDRPRRRRRLMWTLSLTTAAVVIIGIVSAVRTLRGPVVIPGEGLRVERVVGSATLSAGDIVRPGSKVVTGADERIALRAPSGHALRLDRETTLRVNGDRKLALIAGGIYVDRIPSVQGAAIAIETPAGTIEDAGTQFEVRVSRDTVDIAVREGSVSVLTRQKGTLTVQARESVVLEMDGSVLVQGLGVVGAWPWAESIAPPMAIEGRPLREFLDWAARERGVTLRLSDGELAEKAASVVLHGTIEGMSLEQAVSSVLQASGLSARWEKDALLVFSP